MAAKVHCESSRQLGFALFYTPPSTFKRRKNSIYVNLECLFRLVYGSFTYLMTLFLCNVGTNLPHYPVSHSWRQVFPYVHVSYLPQYWPFDTPWHDNCWKSEARMNLDSVLYFFQDRSFSLLHKFCTHTYYKNRSCVPAKYDLMMKICYKDDFIRF